MAQAAAPGAVRRWPHPLTVVRNGEGPLAERRAAAEAAAAGPREQVAGLEAALKAAVDGADFAEAATLQEQLTPAREALKAAELEVRLIDEAAAEAERERQAVQREVQEAQHRARAQEMLDTARVADQQAREATDEALGLMRSNLLAARAALDEARRLEAGVLQARRQEIEARRQLGEWGSDPGPLATGSNQCQVLADTDPLVRQLARWRP